MGKKCYFLTTTIIAGLVLSDQAMAESVSIEQITVTARKRAESLQAVPVAVSAVSGEQMDRLDAVSVMDLSAVVPNFQAPKNTVSFGAPQFYMRGAGRANNNWNAENAVAVFIDDVYMQSTAGAYIEIIDFERVEVLRGPQGTLYGRNATTGAIKFIPRKPDLQEATGKAEVTVGSNERIDVKAAVSIPVVENKYAVKFDVYRTANSGYLTLVDEANNELDDEYGDQEHYGVRIANLWAPSESVEVELNLDYARQKDGTNLITPIAPANPLDLTQLLSKRGTVKFNPVFGPSRAAAEPLVLEGGGGSDFEGYGAVLKFSWDTGFGTFKSITGYREYEDTFLSQLSGRSVPSTIFGVTLYSTVDSFNDFKQFTQELQFSGNFGESFDYVIGAYYFKNDWFQSQYGSTIGVPAEFSPVTRPGQTQSFGGSVLNTDLNSKSYAIYLDATWQVLEDVALFFGARQTWDKKNVYYDARFEDNILNYPGFPVDSGESWSEFTPRFGANWQITPDVLVYASYSRGYKAGNLEGDRATSPGPATNWLDPEIVKTIEVGIKAEWFDGRVRTNITGFLSDYSNKADLISPQTVAIADAEIDGLEFEVIWLAGRNLSLWLNAGLIDAKYTDADPNHPIYAPDPTGFVLGLDADPVMTPKYSLTAGFDYTMELGDHGSLDFGGSIQAVDDHYNGLGVHNYDSEIVKAYEVLDAYIRYTMSNQKLSITLGVNNLTDEEYYTTGFFGSVPEYAGRYYADGRSWYVRLRYEY